MGVVKDLMLSTNFSVNGFQDTLLAPTLNAEGTWNLTSNVFKGQKALSINIHHTGQDWCVSFQYETDDSVYVLDSNLDKKAKNCLTDSLQIQLAQIYDVGKQELNVKIPRVQQQNNGHDCVVFAIASLVEFITDRYKDLQNGEIYFSFITNIFIL